MENQKDKKKKKVLMPFGLRNKLMAAISMLLVSSIMMVSSTYAWFTLSTAPEVKGISTSVGANGNLEMALLNTDSFKDLTKITSAVGDSSAAEGKTLATANLTWGNLVNLKYEEAGKTGNYYGLDKIKLMPARLNVTDAAKLITDKLLSTPKYGNDGRVTALSSDTFSSSQLDAHGFVVATGAEAQTYGVRAVGESSTMTPQEKGLANAKSNYGLNLNAAKNEVSKALKDNMQNLANAMLGYTGTADYVIKTEEIAAITALLNGIDKGLDKIDMAYGDVLRAYAANQIADATAYDTALKTVVVPAVGENEPVKTPAVTFENATYTQAIEKLADLHFCVPTDATAFNDAVGKLTTMRNAVAAARAKTTGESPNYKDAVQALVNPDGMTMMGLSMKKPTENATPEDIAKTVYKKDTNGNWVVDKDKLAGKAFGGALVNGMELVMGESSGLFADIAKVTGNYSASNNIDVKYGDLTVTGAAVVMKTNVTQNTAVGTALQGIQANADVTGNTKYITDTYGYVIDLAVRTNAANSKLQLAKDGVQRVYTDATNTETMGGGSTMTFEAAKVDGAAVLQDVQVQRLMEAIRVVFFNPNTGDIYGYAIPGDFTVEGGKTTGKLVLQTATLENGKLRFTPKTDDDLMDLQQNTATKISVLVYLDGDTVDNSMVANAAESITGSLNLQFKSSAKLVPMENSTLKQGKTTTGTQH